MRIAVPGDVFLGLQNYINSGLVESAEVNTYGVYVSNSNDTHYSSQWNLNQGSDADIDMPEAWNIASGSSAIIIGILDSGNNWTHEDLGLGTDNYQNIWLNPGGSLGRFLTTHSVTVQMMMEIVLLVVGRGMISTMATMIRVDPTFTEHTWQELRLQRQTIAKELLGLQVARTLKGQD